MIKNETENSMENICDLKYLTEMMGWKKHLIKGVIDAFLKQIPEELNSINEAIKKTDYASIKRLAHTMKSSTSIMGVSILMPALQQMENLGAAETGIEKIIELNREVNLICLQAVEEIEREKHNYA